MSIGRNEVGAPITCSWADRDSQYTNGQILELTGGQFRGTTVRVNGPSSYWSDADGGHWEIVLEVEKDGEWVTLARASEAEVDGLTYNYSFTFG